MTKERPIKISLFGTGCTIYYGTFNQDIWDKLNSTAKKLNLELSSAIFDSSFFDILNDPQILALHDLGNKFHIVGLQRSVSSQIQIQVYRKKRRIVKFDELYDTTTLFPIYNVVYAINKITPDKRSIFIVEEEIGLISQYSLLPNINLDKLEFDIRNIVIGNRTFELLVNLVYDSKAQVSNSQNCLVSRQFAIVF